MVLSFYHRKYGKAGRGSELKSGKMYLFRVQVTKNKLDLDRCILTSLSTHFALYGEQKYVSYKLWQFRFRLL